MNADKFSSLAALTEQLGEDVYRIRTRDAHSRVTIIAPHGGYIEPGTSVIASRVAGSLYNLFDFQGLQRENGLDLHITATNFRHPRLEKLLKQSAVAVSLHGMFSQGTKDIWLGGMNKRLKELLVASLKSKGFGVNANSPKYKGASPHNIVNMTSERGAQLELSEELLADLFVGRRFYTSHRNPRTTARFDELVAAIQDALFCYAVETSRTA